MPSFFLTCAQLKNSTTETACSIYGLCEMLGCILQNYLHPAAFNEPQ